MLEEVVRGGHQGVDASRQSEERIYAVNDNSAETHTSSSCPGMRGRITLMTSRALGAFGRVYISDECCPIYVLALLVVAAEGSIPAAFTGTHGP